MATRTKTNTLERLMWEADVRLHPADANLAAAFEDWLQDAGWTPAACKRRVVKCRREGNEEAQRVRVQVLLNDDGPAGQSLRRTVRVAAGLRESAITPIAAVCGGSRPQLLISGRPQVDYITSRLADEMGLAPDGAFGPPHIATAIVEVGAAWCAALACRSTLPLDKSPSTG